MRKGEEKLNSLMNVAVAVNRSYMKYLYVMLTSLLENNSDQEICIYVMSADLTEEQEAILQSLAEQYRQSIFFLHISEEMFSQELPVSNFITIESYFRLALPELLPKEQERVLYLDVDIIVNQPIGEFYHMDFEGKTFCACRDVGDITVENIKTSPLFADLRERPDFVYFNSGVLLMDLQKLRKETSFSHIMEQAMRVKEYLKFHDQDLLNYLYYGDVRLVDEERYNLFARTAYNAGYTCEQVKSRTAILHYAGPKPWRHEEVRYPLESFWWEYAKKTPYYVELLEDMVLTEINSGYMDQLYRNLQKENEELRQLLDRCVGLLQK